MRIAVDGRHLAGGRGIARYSRALLDASIDPLTRREMVATA